jgi:hypothetical protein
LEIVRFEVLAVPTPEMLLPAAVRTAPSVIPPLAVSVLENVPAPLVREPMVAALEKRFVDDAVVAKNVVLVALPRVVFWLNWYATDVVE